METHCPHYQNYHVYSVCGLAVSVDFEHRTKLLKNTQRESDHMLDISVSICKQQM